LHHPQTESLAHRLTSTNDRVHCGSKIGWSSANQGTPAILHFPGNLDDA